jgi:chromate transport protein ChrA
VTTHSREVLLKGFGSPPAQAIVVVETLAIRDRLRRAAIALGLGMAAAVVALPIPLVHLVLVPAALLLGIMIAALRLGQRRSSAPQRARVPTAAPSSGWAWQAECSSCRAGYTAKIAGEPWISV